jgi:hypothetical protein
MVRRISFVLPAILVAAFCAPAAGLEFTQTDVNLQPSKYDIDVVTGQMLKIGGFSGMVPAYALGANRYFHIITDRGPNMDVFEYVRIDEGGKPVYLDADGNETTDISLSPAVAKGFAAPQYGPALLLVQVPPMGLARIVSATSLTKPNGDLVSGLPNRAKDPSTTPPVTEEGPLIDTTGNPLEVDPDGIDAEGITVAPDGMFWICDEYPSVCAVSPEGIVVLRFVPQGNGPGRDILTLDRLPQILTKRVPNRGLEGIAALSSNAILTSLQRPLANPDKKTSEASRNIRLLRIDVDGLIAGAPGAIRQLIYLTEGKAAKGIYISDLFALAPDVVLASERQTNKIFTVCLAGATDVSGLEGADGKLLVPVEYDYLKETVDAEGNVVVETVHIKRTTIEQLQEEGPDGTTNELALAGIVPVTKTMAADLADIVAIDGNNGKFEGLAVFGNEVFICPDNDFDLLYAIRLKADEGAPLNMPELQYFDPPNSPRIFRIQGADLTTP